MPEAELPDPDELAERGADAFGRRVALVTAVCATVNGFFLLARVPFLQGGH